MKIEVYKRNGLSADLWLTFQDDDDYQLLLPELERIAKEDDFIFFESIVNPLFDDEDYLEDKKGRLWYVYTSDADVAVISKVKIKDGKPNMSYKKVKIIDQGDKSYKLIKAVSAMLASTFEDE